MVVGLLLSGGCGGTDGPQTKNPDQSTTDATSDTGTPGSPDASTDTAPPPAPPGVPSDLETEVTASPPQVGTPLSVRCKLLDQHGNRISPPEDPKFRLVHAPDEKFDKNDNGDLIPTETGKAQVACAAPSLSLVDDTPATFDVAAGPPHTVRTSLDEQKVTAGTTVEASCRVYDKYDNRVENAKPSVQIDAMGSGIDVQNRKITIERADIYRVTCHVAGAEREVGASLEVNPGLPSSIAISPVPQKSVYSLGEVVRFPTIVNDTFGNRVRSADIDYSISPSSTAFGRARWEFNTEGEYTVTATVTSQTKNGQNLSASETIVVNSVGPSIDCDSPQNGKMLDQSPAGSVEFQGTVEDTSGVQSVEVNGQSASLQSGGTFTASVSTSFGINFVDIVATDQYGAQNSKTCAFLISDDWEDENDYMSDSVALDLQQDALDDGIHYALNSVADIIDEIINSAQLEVDLDDRLWNDTDNDGENDYWLKDSCDADTLLGCAHYSKVKYIRDPQSGSPGSGITSSNNSVSLDWVYGGMDISTTLNDVGIRLLIDSSVCGTVKGWMRVSNLDIDLTTDIDLSNHQVEASLRNGSTNVSVGTVNPDFGGVCGSLADVLQGVLQDTMQNAVKGEVKNAIENNVPSLLDSLVSSLDVSSLGRNFSVPELDGSGSVDLNFNVRMSSVDVDPSQALIGAGTKFTTIDRIATPTKGVPVPSYSALHDPSTNEDVAAAVYGGMINHVLHALWRGGLFDTDVDPSALGGSVPSGATATLSTSLPPVATIENNGDVEVRIGAATIELTYPGLFDQPVRFDVGAVVRTGANLTSGDAVDFDNVTIQKLYFAPQDISLDSQSRATIESFLTTLFQSVVDRALNKGLRSFPIPSFEITPTLGQYDLPTGQRLGLTNASLKSASDHLVMEGNFGKK